MLNNSDTKKNNAEWKLKLLQLVKYCLKRYQETKDEIFYQYAEKFNESIKNEK